MTDRTLEAIIQGLRDVAGHKTLSIDLWKAHVNGGITALQQQAARIRELETALQFYADFVPGCVVGREAPISLQLDHGQRARQALKGSEE
jgi:hypothetical protein